MKVTKIKAVILTVALIGFNNLSAVNITGFGVDDFTIVEDFTTFSAMPNADFVSISGSPMSSLAGLLPVQSNITGLNVLELSGTFTSGAGSFSIVLLDSSLNDAVRAVFMGGSYDDLVSNGLSTLTLDSFTDSFVFSEVSAITIAGGGSVGSLVSGNFDQLNAVPEPSTYALLAGVIALGFIIVRRRCRA